MFAGIAYAKNNSLELLEITAKPMDDFEKRERNAGMFLAGNDTMSGRRGGKDQTMSEREALAGLNLAGNDTMSGRASIQSKIGSAEETATRGSFGTQGKIAERGRFGTQGRLAGEPLAQRDSEDGVETIEIRPETLGGGSIHAFQLVQVAIDDLCVRQGTIGSVIPTISGTPLEADHTQNSLNLPGTATREYWLKVTLDASGGITTVTIETTEPGANSATQAKLLLGSVETNSGDIVAFNSNLSGSQALASCGATHFFGVI